MRKANKYYDLSYETCKVISAKAYAITFLVPAAGERPEEEISITLPKSQVELDEDTQTVYASSWILKQKIKNEDQGFGQAPQFFIDWLMDEIDWEEGDEPNA